MIRLSLEKLIRLFYAAKKSEDARQRVRDVNAAIEAYHEELEELSPSFSQHGGR